MITGGEGGWRGAFFRTAEIGNILYHNIREVHLMQGLSTVIDSGPDCHGYCATVYDCPLYDCHTMKYLI